VFAGFERFDGLLGVIGDRGVDVDGVDLGVAEKFVVIGVALRDAEGGLQAASFFGSRWQTAMRLAFGWAW
jgi:hypothetical protein